MVLWLGLLEVPGIVRQPLQIDSWGTVGEIAIITHYGNDATVEHFFRRPNMAICTDGLMPGPGQKPHPRAIGGEPRVVAELGAAHRAEQAHRPNLRLE